MESYNIYTIEDTKANKFGPLFEAANHAVMIRSVKIAYKENPFPSDFIVHLLGTREANKLHIGNNETYNVKDLISIED